MENKTIEFLRGFNEKLSDTNQYQNLGYINDGYSEAILFPQQDLWDDNNDPTEYQVQITLSRLYLILNSTKEVVEEQLAAKINEFTQERQVKLPKGVKLFLNSLGNGKYKAYLRGEIDENESEEFLDVLKEDFQYIFEGLELEVY